MRLPYLQVTQETWSRARALAGALGVDRHRAMGLLLDLWAWAVDLGREDAPPTGEIPGKGVFPARMLAGAVDWPGDAEALVMALCAVGVLEGDGAGALRVRGMDRYKRTWEKNHRRKPAPSAPETGTIRAGTGGKPAPQTQTQTQTYKEEEKAPFLVAPKPTQPNPPVRQTASAAATVLRSALPEGDSLRDCMEAVWLQQHRSPYAWTYEDDQAMRPLLQKASGDMAAILLRWKRAVAWVGFPQVASLRDLAKQWNHFAKEQTKPADKSAGDRPRL